MTGPTEPTDDRRESTRDRLVRSTSSGDDGTDADDRESGIDTDGGDGDRSTGANGSGSSITFEKPAGFGAETGSDAETGTDGDGTAPDPDETEPTSERDGPLGTLASTVNERQSAHSAQTSEDSPELFDELFERRDIAAIDRARLWERLESENAPADLGSGTDERERRREPEPEPELERERDIREIEKRSYCHQCEHFSEPPDLECTREGTDVLELSSLDRFRVADCPVVLEEADLERRY